jgi:Fic family protein
LSIRTSLSTGYAPEHPRDRHGEHQQGQQIDPPGLLLSLGKRLAFWVFTGMFVGMFSTDTLRITAEVLTLVARLDEFKGAWRAFGTLAPERLQAMRRVATIESIGSSTRIEGSRLSDHEVATLLAGLSDKSFKTRDEQEVAGYAEVMELVFSSWEHIPVNENHLQQLHRDLLVYSDKDGYHRGHYKTTANNVSAFDAAGREIGVVFATATPFDTPRLMTELVEWYRTVRDSAELHPLLVIGIFVVVLLEIHPFQDGNGRLSRVLTTLLLLKAGYAHVPYSSLESIIEQNKQGYYIALRQTQSTIRTASPDWQPWLLFFLRSLSSQVKRLEEKVANEKLVLARLPELSVQILELARARGRISNVEATDITGANRNTVKVHLRRLTEMGHLVKHGAGRAVWYVIA